MDTSESERVIAGLRQTLRRSKRSFASELEGRIRQLLGDMIDGRLLPKVEAEQVRGAVLEHVRTEALVVLDPSQALAVLDLVKMYGFVSLEPERPRLEAARAAQFPPPAAATWPEIDALRRLALDSAGVCRLEPPADNVYFAERAREAGTPLPDELVALYAAVNGFELSVRKDPNAINLALEPGDHLDERDPKDGYPRRAVVFCGGDGIHLSVYRDRKKAWWLVHDHDGDPVAKTRLDLPALLRFGIRRVDAESEELLATTWSWETFFRS